MCCSEKWNVVQHVAVWFLVKRYFIAKFTKGTQNDFYKNFGGEEKNTRQTLQDLGLTVGLQ
jgi:hypothetical protein